jgi:thioredoxin reductase
MDSNHQTIIIGAGPAGTSTAVYLARFCHPVTILDAPNEVHGRTAMASSLRNFLGHTLAIPGPEFIERLKQQRANYAIDYHEAKVTKVSRQPDDSFTIETDKGQSYHAKYLVLAVGVGDNMPEIDGLDPYYDTGIFHCLTCDWYDHRDQKAVVIANDDRGISTALMINHLHQPPSLAVVPAKEAQYSTAMLTKAKAANIPVYYSPIEAVHGLLGSLSAISLADGTKIATEVLFTKLGHVRFDTFLDEGGIKPKREPEEGFIAVDWRTFESSVANLFAVGPCNDGPDQAIIAGGEGALAAMEIHRRILAEAGI